MMIELEGSGIKVFVGDPNRQVTRAVWPNSPGQLFRIMDKATALLAINQIVRQGEGASAVDPTESPGELAHYYEFQEIVEGRRYVAGADGTWAFDGAPVPFDPDGVFPMADNPDTSQLPPGSRAVNAAIAFDQTYTKLLQALQGKVNGYPEGLSRAVGLMFSLRVQAQRLMAIPIDPSRPETAGPSFQVLGFSGIPYRPSKAPAPPQPAAERQPYA